jgi:hypothetical protein
MIKYERMRCRALPFECAAILLCRCRAGGVRLLTLGHRHFLRAQSKTGDGPKPCKPIPLNTFLSCDRILEILSRSTIAAGSLTYSPSRRSTRARQTPYPYPCSPFARPPTPSPKSQPLKRHSCRLLKFTAMGRLLSTFPRRHHSSSRPTRSSRHRQRFYSTLPFMARRCWANCSIPSIRHVE